MTSASMAGSYRTSGRARSIHRHFGVGIVAVAFLCLGVGGWAATTELSGAVIAHGTIVVDSEVKRVQHPTGGVVGELHVREGDRVTAGDVLVRLDQTQARANFEIISKSLDELVARQARLEAELEGTEAPRFPEDVLARKSEAGVAQLIAGEERLFQTRREARAGQRAQLRERVAQLEQEISGITASIAAKRRESELIETERAGVEELRRKKLVTVMRVTEVERAAAQIDGDRSQLVAAVARARAEIAETELKIIQIEQDLRAEVGRELAEIRAKLSEFREREVAAADQLARVDIRAPQDGFVHQLAVHTIGGVVQPGETLMLIVPSADRLTVEAKIQPQEIDRVKIGQPVALRFSAFDQRTTPEIEGSVSLVSADVSRDDRTGLAFYTARVEVTESELARLGELRLVPGMPVDTFIRAEERTALSYLLKPLSDQIARAFRER